MSVDEAVEADFKLTINISSPELVAASLVRAVPGALHQVASSANDYPDNLEPELVRISQSTPGHAAIAPAPVRQVQQAQLHNGPDAYASAHLGPTSSEIAMTVMPAKMHDKVPAQPQKAAKAKRLGRACDACSRRKVKCDHERPCRNCQDLNLECTFQRPAKRRGPVNRIAEEIRKRKQTGTSDDTEIDTAFASPEPEMAHTPAPFVSAELLGTFDAIKQFAQVFFLYIYPLYPFPHEGLFMKDLESRSDIQNSRFVALLASIVGVTVASFPRLARKICSEHDLIFDRMVGRCLKIATDLRGAQIMLRHDFDIMDAITSFFLGLVASRTDRWLPCRHFWSETEIILDFIRSKRCSSEDQVVLQLAKRVQSTLYIERRIEGEKQIDRYTHIPCMVRSPSTGMPEEVDDEHISSSTMKSQSADTISILTALVVVHDIYRAYANIDDAIKGVINEERVPMVLQSIAAIKDIILAAPAGLTSPFTPAIPTAEAMDSNGKHTRARLDVQKVAVQLTALTCRTQAALHLRQLNANTSSKESNKTISSVTMKAQAEVESIAMELALLLKRLEMLHVEPQWSNFVNKMKIMLAPMQEMIDTNEDAAFVVLRMADFEQ